MNPIKLSQTLQDRLVSYLTTTFDVNRDGKEEELAIALHQSFNTPGALFNGPFLELTPPYQTGKTLEELIHDGILSPKLLDLPCFEQGKPIPLTVPLYSHQETAICRLALEGRNVVISSGTGSGKTECFLIPILNDLLIDDTPGVRAVIIYPLNALVNDQLDRLRVLLKGTNITFGRYTGELLQTEAKARRVMGHELLPNEIICRDQIQKENQIPQILITNYAMLEYLLLRPEDASLFNQGLWKFIVLDEAHTYAGAKGIEVGLLLRRLKHRLNKRLGETRCIATSATLTDDDAKQAAKFAEALFGETFTTDDIIFGQTDPEYVPTDSEAYTRPAEVYIHEDFEALLEEARNEEGASTDEIARRMHEMGLISDEQLDCADQFNEPAAFLWQVLKGNEELTHLRRWMVEKAMPIAVKEVAKELFGSRLEEEEEHQQALYHLIELGAMARPADDKPSLLPARYHLFARPPQGFWICLNPDCSGKQHNSDARWSRLFATHRERCDACACAVYPLTVCRTCGQPYIRMEQEGRNGPFLAEADPLYQFMPHYFTWQPVSENQALAEIDDEEEVLGNAKTGDTTISQDEKIICLKCKYTTTGKTSCRCKEGAVHVKLYLVTKKVTKRGKSGKSRTEPLDKMRECCRCHDSAIKNTEIVTPINMATRSPLSVITQELYRQLPMASKAEIREKPGAGRKLLSFYDSRQGAARFAAFLQDGFNQQIYRHLIPHAIKKLAASSEHLPDLEELTDCCTEMAWESRIFHNDIFLDELSHSARYMSRAQRKRFSEFLKRRIVAEFTTRRRRRQSLEALGVVAVQYFEPHRLPNFTPLAKKIGLSDTQTRTLIEYLLDYLRQAKVITLPEGVKRDDEVFGRNRFSFHLVRSKAQKYEMAWIGATPRQRRRRLVQKVLQHCGLPATDADVEKVLTHLFDWLIDKETGLMEGHPAEGYQLSHNRLFFQQHNVKWYRCNQCQRLNCRGDSLPCPHSHCHGTLERIDIESIHLDNYYYQVFTRELVPMRVEEHTAQLDSAKGREYQGAFKKGDINVLSCSTTFEMGIDLGDLQGVVMSNIPPTVANYKQRAGRAGRRSSGTAFILAWASLSPHDQTYFSLPSEIISGRVRVPHIELQNELICQRHVNAIILSAFLRHQKSAGYDNLSRVGPFFDAQSVDKSHFVALEQWVEKQRHEIERFLAPFVTAINAESDAIDGEASPWDKWISGFIADMSQKGAQQYENVAGYYKQAIEEAKQQLLATNEWKEIKSINEAMVDYAELLARLRDTHLIKYLSERGVLPSYSFPLHTVELRVDRQAHLRLQRDLRYALREYAPGQEVVADKRIWRSDALQFFRETPLIRQYRICEECHHLQIAKEAGIPLPDPTGKCPMCGTKPSRERRHVYRYVRPDGFRTLAKSGRPAGQYVHRIKNLTRSALLPSDLVHSEPIGQLMACGYQRNGQLLYVNEGFAGRGFKICLTCGKSLKPKARKCDGKHKAKPCPGERIQVVTLGFMQETDTLHLSFNSTENVIIPGPEDNAFWLSLMYALLQGASHALQIERRDIDGVLHPRAAEESWQQTIVLYDNVPGGAGYVKLIRDEIQLVIAEALRIASCVDCAPETSCHRCLRDYNNQLYYSHLKRGPVANFLEALYHALRVRASLNEIEDSLPGVGEVVAIDRPRWLMQQISQARHEVIMVVDQITRQSPIGESKMWLEVLQELLVRGVRVQLYLTSLPFATPKKPESLLITKHLQLLLDRGVSLWLTKERPAWRVIIDARTEVPRALKLADESPFILGQNTGKNGLLSTIHPQAVTLIRDVFDSDQIRARQVKAEELRGYRKTKITANDNDGLHPLAPF